MLVFEAAERFAMASAELSPHYRPGDRVRVDSDVTTTPVLPGHVGIVKEVILDYAADTIGYNISLEDDPRPSRIWYFLQGQLKPA
jgi:hypothetical protein